MIRGMLIFGSLALLAIMALGAVRFVGLALTYGGTIGAVVAMLLVTFVAGFVIFYGTRDES